MTKYAVYDNQVFTGVEREMDAPPVLSGKPFREFYTVLYPAPVYDPATQKLMGRAPVADHGAKTHSHVWQVADMTAEELAAKQKQDNAEASEATVKADAFFAQFTGMTPAQLDTYIDNNASNLAGLRTVVKRIAKIVLIMAQRISDA